MRVISGRNAHCILPNLAEQLLRDGLKRDSRYGPVIMFPEPTTLVYEKPMERVVFWPERDANPFFHLIESLWMLGGRRDVKFISAFLPRMTEFSDNGKTFHAAYGHRWRKNFGKDQLFEITTNLKKNPDCRRQTLGVWDVKKDLGRAGKDLPCNVGATFQINTKGQLDMVVHNRSNDAWLGALGANCVHYSVLQEYLAAGIGVPMGRYWQVSSNMHIYLKDLEKLKKMLLHAPDPYRQLKNDPYYNKQISSTVFVDTQSVKIWEEDLEMWMKNPLKVGIRSAFFKRIATPLWAAHRAYRNKAYEEALEIISLQMPNGSDWKRAATEWLQRRMK